jgi:hypothetical protein
MAKTRKQIAKLAARKCVFCGESNYTLLDLHRIIPGEHGGTYNNWNTIACCCRCHRLIHAGEIIVMGKRKWTGGPWCLHVFIDGEERFIDPR